MASSEILGAVVKRAGRGFFRLSLALAFMAMLAAAPMHPLLAQEAADMPPAAAAAAGGAQSQGIAAIVNDEIISRYDLDQRIKLVMVTSSIPPTQENVSRLEAQILRSLVDERLELQEAKKENITVADADVQKSLDAIAGRSGMNGVQVIEFLKKNGVTANTLITQIRADLAWNQLVSQQFGSQINIGANEVDEVMKKLEAEADQPRFALFEILLTFDNPSQEQEVATNAKRLVEQIRKGAPFTAVARQFSQSASAANGGELGWVTAAELPEQVADVVRNMRSGEISDPIRTVSSYYIVALQSRQNGLGPDPMRDQYQLIQVLLPLTPDAPREYLTRRNNEAAKIAREFKTCANVSNQVKEYLGGMASPVAEVIGEQLEPSAREEMAALKPGQATQPKRTERGVEFIIICNHKADLGSKPTREQIENSLYSQQLSLMSRRHLRDLSSDAVIELR
jgi:peptidyl-prolyl cis-trans isomerase SurA